MRRLLGLGVLALSYCLSGAAARAAADIWISTSSGLWGTAGNWSGGVVPTSTSTVTFDNATGLDTSITLVSAAAAKSLTFSATGGAAYTFDTAATVNVDTLTLGSGITNSDTKTQVFYNAFVASASQTWAATSGGLDFYGNVGLGTGATAATLTVNGADAVLISGVISDGGTAAGSLKYSGTSVLTLSGANTYTGTTSVASGGTILAENSTSLGTGATTVASGGTLGFEGGVTDSKAVTVSGAGVAGSAGALESLSGSNTVSGAVTLGAAATIGAASGQTLAIGGTLAIKTFGLTLGNATGTGTVDITGQITGTTGTLTAADGTTVLSGAAASTYAGATTVDSGATLVAAANGVFGTTAGSTTVDSGGTVGFEGGITYSTAEAVTLNGTGAGGAGALANLSGNNSFAGPLTLGSSSTIAAATGTQLTLSGTAALGGFNLTFGTGSSAGTVDTSGVISGTGNVTVAGGTALLGNTANTYVGTTQVDAGATVQVAAGGSLGNASNGVILDGGTLQATGTATLPPPTGSR